MNHDAPRVFVTGGSGFIGRNLIAGLNEQGIRPIAMLRPSSDTSFLQALDYVAVEGALAAEPEKLALAMEGVDWVFHVAAVSDYWRQSVERLYQVNVTGTEHMLAAARIAGVKRFVFTSSVASLGLPATGQLLTEGHEFNLPSAAFPYAHSKHLAERLVRDAVDRGLEAIIVNPTVVLGPGDVNQISGSIVVEAARGRVRFRPPGGANYVDVRDVVAGHLAAARRGRPGERYILGDINLPHALALDIICDILGRSPPRLPLPRRMLPALALGVSGARRLFGNRIPLDANQVRLSGVLVYADPSRARRELDLPERSFADTVRDTVDWYRTHGVI